jgi:DNA-binding transcriptional ArsR family regulator
VTLSKREAVFDALADPTRRGILDLLRRRPVMTAGEIAGAFPRISRPAASRHLRVLRDAGLVAAQEVGREWHYRLEPGPLRDMQEEWLAAFAPLWQTSLRKLKRRAEAEKQERRRGRRRETPPPLRTRPSR